MKLPLRPAAAGFRACLALALLLLTFQGCGHHTASRPASTLAEKDRTLLDRYEDIRAALAHDDLRATKRAGVALGTFLKTTPDPKPAFIPDVEAISTAIALDKARQSFQPLSESMVKLADGVEGYYIFDTPIPAGAQWVQRTPQSDNPYTGKAMHDIGTLHK